VGEAQGIHDFAQIGRSRVRYRPRSAAPRDDSRDCASAHPSPTRQIRSGRMPLRQLRKMSSAPSTQVEIVVQIVPRPDHLCHQSKRDPEIGEGVDGAVAWASKPLCRIAASMITARRFVFPLPKPLSAAINAATAAGPVTHVSPFPAAPTEHPRFGAARSTSVPSFLDAKLLVCAW